MKLQNNNNIYRLEGKIEHLLNGGCCHISPINFLKLQSQFQGKLKIAVDECPPPLMGQIHIHTKVKEICSTA